MILYKFTVPLSITLPRKKVKDKKFILNLNQYRNAHYQILNQAKDLFHKHIADSVTPIDAEFEQVRIHYDYYHGRGGRFDSMNVISIIDKFTCDGLVEIKALPDDDFKTVLMPTAEIHAPDKDNPRCEATVYKVK